MEKFVELEMPDTLDLAQRAEIALNAMINVADEDHGYIPFFSGYLKSSADSPAWMSHGNWDFGSSHGRLVDSIVLVREMTGTAYGEDTELRYRSNLLTFFREDGLCYRQNTYTDEQLAAFNAQFMPGASMIDQRAVILGLATWYAATGDEAVRQRADRHVSALKGIARKERESWYYPGCEYTERGWPSMDAVATRLAYDPCAMWGRQVGPIMRYHKLTGNSDAYELAENFASNIIYRSGAFLPDGGFNGALEYRNGHFHTRMGTLYSILKFAEYSGDAFIINWAKRSYDWALTRCTTFGWTPGDMHDQGYEHETCTLVDAIGCAIALAKCGYAEYWSVAEKFLRNHLVQSQLTDTSWICQAEDKKNDIPGRKTFYRVGDRLKGSFAGYAAPNDFVYDGCKGRGHIMDVQTCCVASGARGLYCAWNSIVTEKNGRVSVNMLFNRASKWLDLRSWLPYEGKVVITAKRDMRELVCRIPEWAPYGAVGVIQEKGDEIRQGSGRTLSYVNKVFIKIGPVRRGEVVTITFPVARRTTRETAVDDEYVVEWAGDDVMGIEPEGVYLPLYKNRDVSLKPQMKKVRLCLGGEKDYE